MKTITNARKEQIKSKIQQMYNQMQNLGMTPNRSSVSLEFIDPYNDDVQCSEKGTIATMAKVAQEIVRSQSSIDYWYLVGLNDLPDQMVFTVYDRNDNGEGNLIVSLQSNYIGFSIFDEELNELASG